MPFSVDDNLDPNNFPLGTNIRQAINILATQIKQLSGKQTYRTKPDYSIATAIKGDTGATGAQGVQGLKGDKGDPGEPAPLDHQHAIAQVEGLQTALDARSPTGHQHAIAQVEGLQTALDAKSPTGHQHQIADVSGLQTALDAKSPTGHQHQIAQVEGLQTALDSKSAINIITSATQPSNPNQGLIWNELNSNNNLVEVWRYINGFWWSEEKLFNVFTPTNTSGVNYYLAMNPAYNYFIKSAHLLFETASTSSYSSVFNFLFQHNKGAGFISTPFTQSFNITAYGTFASIFFVNTKVTSTTDAHQNLRFLLTRTSGSNLIIPSLAIYYHLIKK